MSLLFGVLTVCCCCCCLLLWWVLWRTFHGNSCLSLFLFVVSFSVSRPSMHFASCESRATAFRVFGSMCPSNHMSADCCCCCYCVWREAKQKDNFVVLVCDTTFTSYKQEINTYLNWARIFARYSSRLPLVQENDDIVLFSLSSPLCSLLGWTKNENCFCGICCCICGCCCCWACIRVFMNVVTGVVVVAVETSTCIMCSLRLMMSCLLRNLVVSGPEFFSFIRFANNKN